jgi:hypothetical protein
MGLFGLKPRDCWALSCVLSACQPTFDARASPAVERTNSALRPTAGSAELPPTFDAGDTIEHVDSDAGFFRVHFTRAGRHAVPRADQDGDGVPDYVASVARAYEAVLTFYRGLGYRDPLRDGNVPNDNGGDDRFDIYLLDFPTSADGAFRAENCAADGCAGYMLLENDFVGRNYASREQGIRLVSSHEFFHAVQFAYLRDASPVLAEATAVWASEAFDPSLGDLEAQASGYLERTERSLGQDSGGPVDPFSYGSALFFQHLDESVGREVMRELWERLAAQGGSEAWPQALDAVLMSEHTSSLAAVFANFAAWNLYTAGRADPDQAYAGGTAYPAVSERAVEQPFADAEVRVFPLSARYYTLVASQKATLMAAADLAENDAPGVELLVAREHEGRIVERARSLAQGSLQAQLALEGGDAFHVVLLNTRSEGESLRPRLCIGTPSEVAGCRASSAAGEAGDASGTGAHASGAGCSVAAAPPASCHAGFMLGLLLAAAGYWFGRWRRLER